MCSARGDSKLQQSPSPQRIGPARAPGGAQNGVSGACVIAAGAIWAGVTGAGATGAASPTRPQHGEKRGAPTAPPPAQGRSRHRARSGCRILTRCRSRAAFPVSPAACAHHRESPAAPEGPRSPGQALDLHSCPLPALSPSAPARPEWRRRTRGRAEPPQRGNSDRGGRAAHPLPGTERGSGLQRAHPPAPESRAKAVPPGW